MASESEGNTQKSTSTPKNPKPESKPINCAACGQPFVPPKIIADALFPDEFLEFIRDKPTGTSVLIAKVARPRCPNCTSAALKTGVLPTAKEKKNVPTMKFD